MSPVVEILVTVAATVYLLKQARRFVETTIALIMTRVARELENLHQEIRSDIQTSFELWWENGQRQNAVKGLRKQFGDEVAHIDDESLEAVLALPLAEIKRAAWHLAVHANMGNRDEKIIAKLPNIGGLRDDVVNNRKSHDQELDDALLALTTFGLDPVELNNYFSTSR